MSAPRVTATAAWLLAVVEQTPKVLDLVQPADAMLTVGLPLQRWGRDHLSTFCPVATCRAEPFGVIETLEPKPDGSGFHFVTSPERPRLSTIGHSWICWACGASGGTADFFRALLADSDTSTTESDRDRFARVALGFIRSAPDAVVAVQKAQAWALKFAPDLDLETVQSLIRAALEQALAEESHHEG